MDSSGSSMIETNICSEADVPGSCHWAKSPSRSLSMYNLTASKDKERLQMDKWVMGTNFIVKTQGIISSKRPREQCIKTDKQVLRAAKSKQDLVGENAKP